AAGAIERLLDREHVGIARRLAQEIHHRREALVRMMQQNVFLTDAGEEVGAAREAAWHPGREHRIFQLGALDQVVDRREAVEVDGPRDAVGIDVAQRELPQQELHDVGRAVLRGLEPHRRPVAPMRELALERAAQVIDLFLVDEKIAVAGDPELVTADDLNPGEELLDERLHDAGEEHEGAPALLDGHRHDARQRAGRLHDGELAVAAERVLALQAYDEVETLVLDAGERARRIETQRTQHRLHLVLEILLEPTPRLRRPVVAAEQRDLALRERRQQDLVEATILLGHEAGGALVNGRELLLERQAIGRERARAQLEQLLEAGDPDLEELIEIARGDKEEAQPLEQRHRLVEGLREHAAVELEEGQLAVEVEAGRLEIGCVHAPKYSRLRELMHERAGDRLHSFITSVTDVLQNHPTELREP